MVLSGASVLAIAPAAQAACTPSACDVPFTGTVGAFLATPRVAGVTTQIQSMSDGDFVGRQSYVGAGWEEAQVSTIVYVDGVTRTAVRAFDGKAGRITYLSRTKACTRTVTSSHPNTYKADAMASWTCRARKSSDVDGRTWLRSTLPAARMPSAPSSWFVDYTTETGFASSDSPPTLGIYISPQHWLEYQNTANTIRFQNYIRATESDSTVYTATTAGVPALPSISSLPRG